MVYLFTAITTLAWLFPFFWVGSHLFRAAAIILPVTAWLVLKGKVKTAVTDKQIQNFTFLVAALQMIHFIIIHFNFTHSFFLVDTDYIGIAEVLNNTIKGNWFATNHYTVTSEANYLTHHFAPSLLLLAPFMYLSELRHGYAWGLLFFILLGTAGFYLLVNELNNNFHKLVLLFLYANNLYLYKIYYSWHFELLFVPLFLFFIHFLNKKLLWSIPWLIALLFLKEDIPFYLFLYGIFHAIFKNRRHGIIIAVLALSVYLVIPSLQKRLAHEIIVDWKVIYLHWGRNWPDIIVNMVSSPFKIMTTVAAKSSVIFELAAGFGMFFLFYPELAIVIFPVLMVHLLSVRPWFDTLYNYYSYSVAPFILLASIRGLQRLDDKPYRDKYKSALLLLLMSLVFYRNSLDKTYPHKLQKTSRPRAAALENFARNIPAEARVSVQFDTGAFLSRHTILYPLRKGYPLQDYILMDLNGNSPFYPVGELDQLKNGLLEEKKYILYRENQGMILLKRSDNTSK